MYHLKVNQFARLSAAFVLGGFGQPIKESKKELLAQGGVIFLGASDNNLNNPATIEQLGVIKIAS